VCFWSDRGALFKQNASLKKVEDLSDFRWIPSGLPDQAAT